MDIEKGAVQGPMSEMILDGDKIRALLIEVRGEGMTESMSCDREVPLQSIKMSLDVDAPSILEMWESGFLPGKSHPRGFPWVCQ